MKYIPRLLPYLRPHWKAAIVSLVVMALTSASTLLAPWPLTLLVDNVLGDKPLPPVLASGLGSMAANRTTLLILAVTAGLVITFLSGTFGVLSNYVNTKISQCIVYAFRSDLFHHTQRLSIAYTDQISTGRLMYSINFEATAAGGVIMAIEPLAQGALTIIGMVWISFRIDPLVALLSIAVVPPLYYSVGYYAKRIQPRILHVKGMEGDSLSIVHDALSMLRVIVAFVRETYEVARFRTQAAETVDARVDVTVRQAVFGLVVSVITAIGNSLVLGVGALHVMQGQITTGQLLVLLSYVAAVYKPLQAISTTVGSLQDQFVGLSMGFHVLDTEPIIQEPPDAIVMANAGGDVAFEDVQFNYPGRDGTLKGISFQARAGQAVAVVGPTGAGKTTLASLLPRFYEPSSGRILLDGVDIRQVTLASLRDQISLVPQEPVLFSGSIADNIRYGRLDASPEEIMEAAKAANAHDFIMCLPNQYETTVGERGGRLSGGERQRICVARAFLKNAPLLILDEPTSSVDSRTEGVILEALDRLMVGRTTFMIAHRLSTVCHADHILVLDQGELVEQGSSDELLRRDGLYRQLYEAQLGRRQQSRGVSEGRSPLHALLSRPLVAQSVVSAEGDDRPSGCLRTALAMNQADEVPGCVVGDGNAPAPQPHLVDWLSHAVPAEMQAGGNYCVAVTFRNADDRPWRADADQEPGVALSYHWLSDDETETVVWDGCRTRLPHDVAPGMACMAKSLAVTAPETPGAYRLQISLIQESVAWFEHLGAPTLTVPVNIREAHAPAPPDPSPGKLDVAASTTLAVRPAISSRGRIVLLGMMAKTPVAGVVWQTLHYLVGFQRLGYEVTYLEAHAVHPPMFPDSQAAAEFIAGIMRRFDLETQWGFQALHDDGSCYGLSEGQVKERCSTAELVINLHGATAPLAEHRSSGCLMYLETDPVAMQIDLYNNNQEAIDFLAQHDAFFTFGENYGRSDCKVPATDRFAFKPTRQPVVMDFWSPAKDGTREVFTTVGSWKQTERHGDVHFGNDTYSWSKHFEFLKFLDLPRRTDQAFELALARCEEADKSLLQSHGWRVRDALSLSLDPDAYRHYIGESRGEFTVAKDQNIRLRSGWFSDRSATYLAAGRPVINQDTGFANFLPTGEGLFSFSTIEDILQALESVKADYERHRRAAHELAQEYFNSDVVLRRLLEDVGQ